MVNSNSPLIYDGGLLEGAIVMAELNQPVIFTPFTLSGAMAPVSVAGALVLQNAEALAGIAFSQCVNPGAPAVYGSFTSNVDMKSGSPPPSVRRNTPRPPSPAASLARRYDLPWRSSSATASNAADAQAAYEAQMSLWPVVLGHAHFIDHGFGWLEGGLCASYEKFILDAEMVQMMQEFLKPLDTAEAELGLDAIAEVGPGGHFFGCSHTMARYETAFYQAHAVGLAQLRNLARQRRRREPRIERRRSGSNCSPTTRRQPLDPADRRGARRVRRAAHRGGRRPGALIERGPDARAPARECKERAGALLLDLCQVAKRAVVESTSLTRPTLRHIAEQLGVSTATVSLAMRDNERISQSTRDRVKAALAEHGYIYARSAASLRTSKTHTVGVILNNVSDPFFSALLASLEEALAESGQTVFLCNTNESCERQADFIRTMAEYNADGIIVSPAIGSSVEDFSPQHVPVPPLVFVSRTMFDSDFDFVINDDYEAGRLATERLLTLGHRRIAVVGGDPRASPFGERMRGHRAALERAHVAFDGSLVADLRSSTPRRLPEPRAGLPGSSPGRRPRFATTLRSPSGCSMAWRGKGLHSGKNFALIGHEDVEEASLVSPSAERHDGVARRDGPAGRRGAAWSGSTIPVLRRGVSS